MLSGQVGTLAAMNSQPRFMNAAAVPQAYGISRRTLARREKTDPQFPKGRRLSARLVVFCVQELDSYFRGKPTTTKEPT